MSSFDSGIGLGISDRAGKTTGCAIQRWWYCVADSALGHYLTGQVKDVTDAETAVLFGHEVLVLGKPTEFGVNDPIMSWVDSSLSCLP